MKFDWEDILNKPGSFISHNTARAKVEGGWLIHHALCIRDKISTAICFMEDKDHEWQLVAGDSELLCKSINEKS